MDDQNGRIDDTTGRPGTEPPELTFPDAPRMELDHLLAQLVDRAQELMGVQGRLRGLMRAHRTIIAELGPAEVLHRIADAARDVVGARYAALGVLDGRGGLAEFVHVGMPSEDVAAIGHLPEGKGLLGAVIEDPRPIRIDDLAADPRGSGFPAGHPPMTTFLGVPVRTRDEVFGNLYLTESVRGRFTAEDEELARYFAATAAIMIDNARRFETARRRGDWLGATTDVTRRMLDPAGGAPLQEVTEHAHRLADADLVALMVPDRDRRALRVTTAAGVPAARAAELVGTVSPVGTSLCAHVLTTGEPVRLADAHDHPGLPPAMLADAIDIGPVLVVPLTGAERTTGVLAVARLSGRVPFHVDDLRMAAGFANQAALALELADARAEAERSAVLDERERIATDLHDGVVQRLFATGLALQAVTARLDPSDAHLVRRVVEDLDDTIAWIRTSVFDIDRLSGGAADGPRSRVLDVVTDATVALGLTPVVRFSGPVDTVVAGLGATERAQLVDDVCAVARECLTNAAKHADASEVRVDLVADGSVLTLVVRDDGVGFAAGGRRSGVANLRRRAERRGGRMTLTAVEPHGTRVEWSVPVGSSPN
ncbi:GAF domain-containing protein [Pseudonocardia sp. N23]|uniref:sensor histidine kinase n=1 Tax=Pseudonocardia sp. N23 TaxID=1987376 RepID=UPI000BFB59FC|nr:GAF domain-containing protein [Pseudonocardia sp. N23]GAY07363.1 diguanylate cyclase/phosphodiesterase with PAS/PAC sensor [Pseudonocardia sp. N23]